MSNNQANVMDKGSVEDDDNIPHPRGSEWNKAHEKITQLLSKIDSLVNKELGIPNARRCPYHSNQQPQQQPEQPVGNPQLHLQQHVQHQLQHLQQHQHHIQQQMHHLHQQVHHLHQHQHQQKQHWHYLQQQHAMHRQQHQHHCQEHHEQQLQQLQQQQQMYSQQRAILEQQQQVLQQQYNQQSQQYNTLLHQYQNLLQQQQQQQQPQHNSNINHQQRQMCPHKHQVQNVDIASSGSRMLVPAASANHSVCITSDINAPVTQVTHHEPKSVQRFSIAIFFILIHNIRCSSNILKLHPYFSSYQFLKFLRKYITLKWQRRHNMYQHEISVNKMGKLPISQEYLNLHTNLIISYLQWNRAGEAKVVDLINLVTGFLMYAISDRASHLGLIRRASAAGSQHVAAGGAQRSALRFRNLSAQCAATPGWLHGGSVVWYRALAPGEWMDVNSYEGHTFCAATTTTPPANMTGHRAPAHAMNVNQAAFFTAPSILEQRNQHGVVVRTNVDITQPMATLETRCMQVLIEKVVPSEAYVPCLLSRVPTHLLLKLWRMYDKNAAFTLFYPK